MEDHKKVHLSITISVISLTFYRIQELSSSMIFSSPI